MNELIAELESAINEALEGIVASGDRGLMDAALGALENKLEEGAAMAEGMKKQSGGGSAPKGKKRHKVEA